MTATSDLPQVVPMGDGGADPTAVREQVRDVLATDYDLGEIADLWQISGGYINWSFGARARSGETDVQYFIRKYNRGTNEATVRFEHALVDHLVARGFTRVAPVIRSREGESFVTRSEAGATPAPRHFAVYGFLPGESKYSWCFDTDVTSDELVSCARTLAEYHSAVSDYLPADTGRVPSPASYQGNGAVLPIMELLPQLPLLYAALASRAENNTFGDYLRASIDTINRCVREAALPADRLMGSPSLVVHSDFHAGNVKYDRGDVVALFDFDYARYDYRMFDIGHALHFFCFSWKPESDGRLWPEKLSAFIHAYQEASRGLPGIGPLNAVEVANLVPFLHAGNIFTLDWDIRDYFADPDRDPDEYLIYLRHNVRLMEEIDLQRDAIQRLVTDAIQ